MLALLLFALMPNNLQESSAKPAHFFTHHMHPIMEIMRNHYSSMLLLFSNDSSNHNNLFAFDYVPLIVYRSED